MVFVVLARLYAHVAVLVFALVVFSLAVIATKTFKSLALTALSCKVLPSFCVLFSMVALLVSLLVAFLMSLLSSSLLIGLDWNV